MDVREKLVELLQDENNPVWRWFPNNMAMMQLVDYLISNGVTVLEDCKDCAEATQNCIVKLQEQIAELRSAQECKVAEIDQFKLPIADAILILKEEHKQREDGYVTHLSYGGKGDPAEEVYLDALEMAIAALEWQNRTLPKPPKES